MRAILEGEPHSLIRVLDDDAEWALVPVCSMRALAHCAGGMQRIVLAVNGYDRLVDLYNKLSSQKVDLLAACKEAYDLAEDRTDTYPEPCEDVTLISLMITLKAAIAKAEEAEC